MKYLLLLLFIVMLGLSGYAYYITPHAESGVRKPIVWATDDNPRRRGQTELFNDEHANFDLRIDPVNNGLDKIITQSLAGVGPEVFDGFADQVGLLYDAGLLYDVTDELAKRGITLDQFWPLARPVISIKGRIYGVPFNCGGEALWFHKDLFDRAGLEYPPQSGLTWERFVELAQKLTKRRPDGRVERYGVMGYQFRDVLLTTGGRYFTPDGRRCVLDSPLAVEALGRWLDLQNKYHVMPNPAEEAALSTQGGWGSGIISYFQEKRCAMAPGGRWWLCNLRLVLDKNGNWPFDLGAVERPSVRLRRYPGGPRVTYVNAKSPHKDRAIEFLAFECSQQWSDQINRDADNLPGIMKYSGPGSVFYTYDPHGDRDPGNSQVWKTMLQFTNNTELSPYITPTEVNEIVDKQVQLTTGENGKSPKDALTTAAALINERISENVERTAYLRERFNDGDLSPYLGNPPARPRADEIIAPLPSKTPGIPDDLAEAYTADSAEAGVARSDASVAGAARAEASNSDVSAAGIDASTPEAPRTKAPKTKAPRTEASKTKPSQSDPSGADRRPINSPASDQRVVPARPATGGGR